MASVDTSDTACCTIPAVQSQYEPKGTTQSFAGYKDVYITGPEDASRALVCIFDVYGFYPQTKQGADILAQVLEAKVLMPDFFQPERPIPSEFFPPDTPEKRAKFQVHLGGLSKIDRAVPDALKVGQALKSAGVSQVGLYGFCWGGKVAILAGADSTFDAVAAIHPALLNVGDADKLIVPLGLFPSKDEPFPEYEKLVHAISSKPFAPKNACKYYSTVHHGFAAARADLDDPENKKQFEDVYGRLAGFFKGVWE